MIAFWFRCNALVLINKVTPCLVPFIMRRAAIGRQVNYLQSICKQPARWHQRSSTKNIVRPWWAWLRWKITIKTGMRILP